MPDFVDVELEFVNDEENFNSNEIGEAVMGLCVVLRIQHTSYATQPSREIWMGDRPPSEWESAKILAHLPSVQQRRPIQWTLGHQLRKNL